MVGFPTLAIGSSGTTLTMTFGQAVTGGAGGLTFKDGATTYPLTYSSGSGTTALVFTIGGINVQPGDSCTLAYVASSGNIQLANGSFALESFSATTVTNNSTQAAATLTSATVAANGTSLSLVFNSAVTTSGVGGLTFKDGSNTYTLTSPVGTGTTTITYTIGTTVNTGESCTLQYVSGSGNITTQANGLAVASFGPVAVTNNSTQSGGGSPSLDFSQTTNSMYLPLIF